MRLFFRVFKKTNGVDRAKSKTLPHLSRLPFSLLLQRPIFPSIPFSLAPILYKSPGLFLSFFFKKNPPFVPFSLSLSQINFLSLAISMAEIKIRVLFLLPVIHHAVCFMGFCFMFLWYSCYGGFFFFCLLLFIEWGSCYSS